MGFGNKNKNESKIIKKAVLNDPIMLKIRAENNNKFIINTLKDTFNASYYTKQEMTHDQKRISDLVNSLEKNDIENQKKILTSLEKDPYFKMGSNTSKEEKIKNSSLKMISSAIKAIDFSDQQDFKAAEKKISEVDVEKKSLIKNYKSEAKKVDKVAKRYNTQEYIMQNVAQTLEVKSNNDEISREKQEMHNKISGLINKESDKQKITPEQQKEGLINLLTDPYLKSVSTSQSEELFKQKIQTVAKNALEAYQEAEKYNFKAADKKIESMLNAKNNKVVEFYDQAKKSSTQISNNLSFINTMIKDTFEKSQNNGLEIPPEITKTINELGGKSAQVQRKSLIALEKNNFFDSTSNSKTEEIMKDNLKKIVTSSVDAVHLTDKKEFKNADKYISKIMEARKVIFKSDNNLPKNVNIESNDVNQEINQTKKQNLNAKKAIKKALEWGGIIKKSEEKKKNQIENNEQSEVNRPKKDTLRRQSSNKSVGGPG